MPARYRFTRGDPVSFGNLIFYIDLQICKRGAKDLVKGTPQTFTIAGSAFRRGSIDKTVSH